tara:strand:+ start:267 stop:527 length:261 start_codon:yes stop_codon:yes gene_type:complete
MKHTKGPWLNQNPHIVPEIRGIGYAICEVNTLPHFHEEEQRANARLIAAAPEMYKLLKDVVRADLLPRGVGVGDAIELLINKLEEK